MTENSTVETFFSRFESRNRVEAVKLANRESIVPVLTNNERKATEEKMVSVRQSVTCIGQIEVRQRA